MSHWAKLDEFNKVVEVVVGNDNHTDEGHTWLVNTFGGRWVKTSYNAHITGFRKNFAGEGTIYDEARDAFIYPQPYASWILDEETCRWVPPVEYPGTQAEHYIWDEPTTSWVPFEQPKEQ